MISKHNYKQSKWQVFAGTKWATLLLTLNALFSVFILVAMAIFVDDVASTLAIYFELGAEDKWQIIGKFSTPILISIVSLLVFNAAAAIVCLYYSLANHNYLDGIIKNINLTIIGERPLHKVKGFSTQTTTLANKLVQLQNQIDLAQTSPASEETQPKDRGVDDAS